MSERDMAMLLDLIERKLGHGWIEISDWLRNADQNSLDEIERRLNAGDIQGVIAEVETAAARFAAETHAGFVTAGQQGAAWLDNQLAHTLVRFDQADPNVVQAAYANQLELVRGMTAEARQTVRNVLIDGASSGANPRQLARDIRDSIGLTPNQEQAVRSYRNALEQGDWSNALGRELSSGQGDRTVRRLQRDGGDLTPTQIDSLVERYRQNQLTYRAETIARTESARVVHAGTDEAFRQAIARGNLDPSQLRREWISGPRTRYARPTHQKMNGRTVPYGQLFELPDGTRMKYPGDPAGGADNTANCRCTVATTLTA